ncbi:MAG: DUF411 domain-containing protein [Acidobacteria bacterium]|nr:DUF411 domain-containing protein [Acidobacteriota bacterium]
MRYALYSALLIVVLSIAGLAVAQPGLPPMQVYKSPSCGCCVKWIEYFRQQGFKVTTTDVPEIQTIKKAHDISETLASCHTALVGGYIVEGHVPVEDVKRLLKERPKIAGIAVPGMPIGSPGMEGANPQTYNVFSFDKQGAIAIFSTHRPDKGLIR